MARESDYDRTARTVAERGGCDDWPCDYACLRRGTCDRLEHDEQRGEGS